MSITDELREWKGHIQTRTTPESVLALRAELNAIADRIDAEHESACAEAYGNGVESVALPDLTTYVKLPLDADGEYIRIRDVMDSKVDYLFDGRPFDVRALVLLEDGWEVADGRFGNRYEPNSLRHHHIPTVEDVLREFAVEVCGEPALTIRSGVVEEYASRLRLAGES